MSTLVCVPIMVSSPESARSDALQAVERGADLVEYRVDELLTDTCDDEQRRCEIEAIVRLAGDSPAPCIVTCRPVWEGGSCEASDEARAALFDALAASDRPPRYVDIELALRARDQSLAERVFPRFARARAQHSAAPALILSMHDFQGRPSDLARRLLALRAEPGPSVHKVAFRARSLRDNIDLFDILATRDRPTIALGMGEFGLMSRVLAPKFGGFLTFASARAQAATAPGQPTLEELLGTYRFRTLGPRTSVYGVAGWPVAHSLSPRIHNAGFEQVGHDGVYLPLPIATGDAHDAGYESFKATMLELVEHRGLDFRGCSVTLPHKENLVRLARARGWALDATSDLCGAANTLVVDRGPDSSSVSARVLNTDARAAADSLASVLGELRARRVLVLGAGGVARAIVFELARAGCLVRIRNRTPDRARALAGEASARVGVPVGVDEGGAGPCDAMVNCTSVGMHGGPDPNGSPIATEDLVRMREAGGHPPVLLETVYNPIRTVLLEGARGAGWRTIDGVDMFVRQASAQFRAWTGREAPGELFQRIVRDALAS